MSDSAQLKARTRKLIAELIQISAKSAIGQVNKEFAQEQAHALVRDVTTCLQEVMEAVKKNEISRDEADLIKTESYTAFAAVKVAGFGDEN